MLVEVCANSLESALVAQEAGADRIELCSELGVGGITPSYGLIQMVRERLDIPVHVLIRPRSGHFTYSDLEFEVMLKNIAFCVENGVDGIVSGVLLADCNLDEERTEALIGASRPLKFTFHRAFDWVPNPKKTLQQLEALGVDYILTSGLETSAEKGLDLLNELNAISEKNIVMAGGGIRLDNCEKFKAVGLRAIHLSGTSFGNELPISEKIPMNSSTHLREDQIAVTNLEKVRQIVRSVK
ncbi:copper homeostasis protein CutC [Flagellimonas pacifica]|uniref:PF03932 family protein CutC n=1 Tax=Flagellimonas pacifica TaxID=1247520 RepID=A0A285MV60_9FLAO|nr:copper homeostasis protein CutC [Allomuricauda parva]SNZ01079.1 copper homeostasis protein [Allomuricauda parva]